MHVSAPRILAWANPLLWMLDRAGPGTSSRRLACPVELSSLSTTTTSSLASPRGRRRCSAPAPGGLRLVGRDDDDGDVGLILVGPVTVILRLFPIEPGRGRPAPRWRVRRRWSTASWSCSHSTSSPMPCSKLVEQLREARAARRLGRVGEAMADVAGAVLLVEDRARCRGPSRPRSPCAYLLNRSYCLRRCSAVRWSRRR